MFYIFLFLYPLITFLVERQYILYNLVCIGISAIGFGLQIFEFDELYFDLKDTCCGSENSNNNETCKCKEHLCSRFPKEVKKLISIFVNEILLYGAVVCTIMGVINERTWELNSTLNYFDCLLLVYSVAMEVFVPRLYYIR